MQKRRSITSIWRRPAHHLDKNWHPLTLGVWFTQSQNTFHTFNTEEMLDHGGKRVSWQWLSAASVDFISLVNNGHNGWYLWVVPMVDCLLPIAISHYPHYCPCCSFRCDFTLPIITLARLPPTLAPLCVSNYDCTPPTSRPQYQPFCKCGAHWQNCLCWGLLMPQKPPT